jgi:hypothetical protein
VLPISATGVPESAGRSVDCGDAALAGDGGAGEPAGPAPDCGLGDVELVDVELGDVEP